MFRLQVLISFTVALVLVIALPAWADNDKQDMARRAMLAGEVAPLSELLAVVEQNYQGDVLKVELEDEDADKWGGTGDGKIFIYEIKILTVRGNLVKLKYDAKSLKLLATNDYDRQNRYDSND